MTGDGPEGEPRPRRGGDFPIEVALRRSAQRPAQPGGPTAGPPLDGLSSLLRPGSDPDTAALDEVAGLLARLAVASLGRPELAIFALLSAVKQAQCAGGVPEGVVSEIHAMVRGH